jgi:hypothetical protein
MLVLDHEDNSLVFLPPYRSIGWLLLALVVSTSCSTQQTELLVTVQFQMPVDQLSVSVKGDADHLWPARRGCVPADLAFRRAAR